MVYTKCSLTAPSITKNYNFVRKLKGSLLNTNNHLPNLTDMDVNYFMQLALEQAKIALDSNEVPVGCVIIHPESNMVIATGHNKTNVKKDSTRHAEMEAIDDLIFRQGLSPKGCILYVTCEPCIMCAASLGKIGFKSVYFGCSNDRFGGNGSILSLHNDGYAIARNTPYEVHAGIMCDEAIALFQSFYQMENKRAPESKRRHKRSQEEMLTEN